MQVDFGQLEMETESIIFDWGENKRRENWERKLKFGCIERQCENLLLLKLPVIYKVYPREESRT